MSDQHCSPPFGVRRRTSQPALYKRATNARAVWLTRLSSLRALQLGGTRPPRRSSEDPCATARSRFEDALARHFPSTVASVDPSVPSRSLGARRIRAAGRRSPAGTAPGVLVAFPPKSDSGSLRPALRPEPVLSTSGSCRGRSPASRRCSHPVSRPREPASGRCNA